MSQSLISQDSTLIIEGQVSYLSSANVYVKFPSTEHIEIGDTLYIRSSDKMIPALEVTNKSSISCVATPISNRDWAKSDLVFAVRRKKMPVVPDVISDEQPIIHDPLEKTLQDSLIEQITTNPKEGGEEETYKPYLRGRLAASAHSTFTNSVFENNQRMRYTFSMRGENIKGSRFSTDVYFAYRHNMGDNTEINRRTNALRAYNFAVGYRAGDHTHVTLGRKINRNLANVGAIDGLQVEQEINQFTVGGVIGSRPDIENYGLNFNLFEYGGYVAHNVQTKNGYSETTFGLFEMTNGGETDRRFSYFQHSSMLVENLSLFFSFEMDLYKNVNEEISMEPRLSSLYVSLRYRFSRKFSVYGSYDARKNIIYYETYRTRVEQLLEQETRQGYRLRLNYRPMRYMNIGVTGGYRSQKNNPNESKNLYTYVTYSRVPGIKASLTVSMNRLQTGYLDGSIYNARLSKDLKKGKLYGGLNYRHVNYSFSRASSQLSQHIVGANLSWRPLKDLSISLFYEATYEEENHYNRVHANIIQRF